MYINQVHNIRISEFNFFSGGGWQIFDKPKVTIHGGQNSCTIWLLYNLHILYHA
jgi:hypothetical protein